MRSIRAGIVFMVFIAALCAAPASAAGVSISDDMGGTVTLRGAARRIVSLYAGHTENLIAIGAKKNLVAVSDGDDPRFTGDLPQMPIKPGIEQIVARKPDLVIMRPMQARSQEGLVRQLGNFGIPVLALDPPLSTKAGFVDYARRLGRAAGMEKAAVARAERVLRDMDAAQKKSAAGVFLLTNGRDFSTCGPLSWASALIRASGGVSVAELTQSKAGGETIVPFGIERLVKNGAAIDVIIVQQGAMNSLTADRIKKDARLATVKAVEKGRVYDFPEADVSRPSILRYEASVKQLRALIAK